MEKAKRIRRSLFGQSIVDFDADPWISVSSPEENICQKKAVKKKMQKKQSRLEKAFSQSQADSSQTITIADSTPLTVVDSSQTAELAHSTPRTVVESRPSQSDDPQFQNVSYFQQSSNFQKQNFQSNFQFSQHTHFLNEHGTLFQHPHFPQSFQHPHIAQEQYFHDFQQSFQYSHFLNEHLAQEQYFPNVSHNKEQFSCKFSGNSQCQRNLL